MPKASASKKKGAAAPSRGPTPAAAAAAAATRARATGGAPYERTGAEGGVVEYRLRANGMRLLVAEHRAAPVATFLVVYKVGSRNEAVGHTGATHLLEHMLFKGTPRYDAKAGTAISATLHAVGAQYNATTWYDRTTYFETVPLERLPLAMDIESDRMRHSLLRDADRESERIVVRNELERHQNEPESVLDEQLYAVAFREHPYHHPTIGWRDDVEKVPTARLRAFYDTFYYPDNATAVLVGDVDADAGAALWAEHFGRVPPSGAAIPEVYTSEPPQQGERRFELRRPGEVSHVLVAYHIPAAAHDDTYPLAVLDAVLSGAVGSRVSTRFYRGLVDTGLAVRAYSNADQFRDPGLFKVAATVRPGVRPAAVEEAVLEVLHRVAHEAVGDAELGRAKRQLHAAYLYSREGTSGLAFELGESEARADWRWYVGYPERLAAVKAADLMRVAAKYFGRDNRTVGIFEPSAPAVQETAS
ncbi:MAG TPA: pitrilysin family protein [Myxococcota bacterium]|jgi:zinc protease|nr:pitrilysin family protein [Myxococcota bacterium]